MYRFIICILFIFLMGCATPSPKTYQRIEDTAWKEKTSTSRFYNISSKLEKGLFNDCINYSR